ncbi:DUF4384 domain-containing protein [Methylocella tundrae]|uniref:DUF4384 domain-containing protein n=1 Tax=Methylocella tundrae TaxID=227605 RepID=UPI001FCE718A|nr:DUF4384 domain-containing protein [Methylocella tundrae]
MSASAPRLDVNTEPVVELSRSVTFVTPPGSAPSAVAANIPLGGAARATPAGAPPPFPPQRPVRVAVLDGSSAQLADVTPLESRFEAVAPNQNPELIWDPKSGDVISGGDVIAREVGKDELPGVIDRAAAVRALKQMAARSVQPILLLPDNKVHHLGSEVEVAIDQLSNRSLLLFNLAGDGTVQLLYPQNESEAELMNKPEYRLPIKVRGPFGADQIVAITAPERMPQLEQALGKLNARRTAGQLVRILSQYADAGMRLGSVGVFTAP